MSILVLECESKEPIIIGNKQIKNIIHSANLIPPNTVRGAIYSKIVRESCHSENIENCGSQLDEEIKKEIIEPTAIFGPIKLMVGGSIADIAHIFIYKDKLKGGYHFSTLTRSSIDLLVEKEHIEDLLELIPSMEKSYPKSISGSPIIRYDDKISEVKIPKWSHINVRIDENRRSTTESDQGSIFSYEVLPPGIKFKQLIYFEDEKVANKILEKLGGGNAGFTIYIGRGITRGFGCTECILNKKTINEMLNNLPNYYIKNRTVIAIAQTPVFELTSKIHQERNTLNPIASRPYIEKIEKDPIILKIKEYTTENKATWKTDKVPGAFIKKTKIKSWAMLHGPRPEIEAADVGSIFIYKVHKEESQETIQRTLRLIELTGTNEFSRLGFNHLEFLKEDDLI